MNTRYTRLAAASALAAWAWTSAAQAAPSYQATVVPGLIAGSTPSQTVGYLPPNGSGQFIGNQSGGLGDGSSQAGFLDQGGARALLSVAGYADSQALAINNGGAVAGSVFSGLVTPSNPISRGNEQAVVWRPGGAALLGTLGGSASQATGINDAGTVVGNSWTAGNQQVEAFVWRDGKMQSLFAGTPGIAIGINNRGDVIGAVAPAGNPMGWGTAPKPGDGSGHWAFLGSWPFQGGGAAFAYVDGQVHLLGADLQQAGIGGTYLRKINEAQQVLGNDLNQAFVWSGGAVRVLQNLALAEELQQPRGRGAGYDINDHGDVVGSSFEGMYQQRATLWSGSEVIDLNDVLASPLDGTSLQYAFAIDNQSRIFAVGADQRIYQLTAVPEPSTLALCGLGLAAAGWMGAKRRGKLA